MKPRGFSLAAIVVVLVTLMVIAGIVWRLYAPNRPPVKPGGSTTVTSSGTGTIVAAGDIACEPDEPTNDPAKCQQDKTYQQARALQPDLVLALGDLQYNDGNLDKFNHSFNANWGQFKDKLYATPGNHEYQTANASGYFSYMQQVRATPAWYSLNFAGWHIISLNSNCEAIGGCDATSPQTKWLAQDLTDNPTLCTIAFWHHPHFTSGHYTNDLSLQRSTSFWDLLVQHKTDVILNGHDHLYERFAPQGTTGQPQADGPVQFTVGTGGKSHYSAQAPSANSQKIIDNTFGVLQLKLQPNSYTWQFVATDGTVLDSGSQPCN